MTKEPGPRSEEAIDSRERAEVVYLMSGPAHMPYLVVSLATLRRHWNGTVRVFAWPESIGLVREVAKDARLNIVAELREPAYRARRDEGRQGKNDQFIAKIALMRSLRGRVDLALYMDADTSVHGSLEPLLRAARASGFLATRFSSWTTANPIVQARLSRLLEFAGIDRRCVEEVLRKPWPSVNGGVFCCRPESPVLEVWERWTWEARTIFIADETVLHALLPLFVSSGQMAVWPDGRYNCSCNPAWMPDGLAESGVAVWHYHGDSATRPDKLGGHGYRRWWPLWQKCLAENVGNCRSWAPLRENGWLGNKWFRKLAAKG